MQTTVTIRADGREVEVEVPDEWLLSPRGWELIGGRAGAAYEALPAVRDADEADPVPKVRAGKAAKA